ncbi:hypothetical protein F909_02877 [Acinetobacter sp. ANC 3929]|uniref:hypothetical protein n=1 Tax=Acinetobacter sp. ANC 3929 TaxID=1217707 RepID=UPI0002CFB5B7|nr:hypothetical protein [Acinetobacter sp. ANC 3929]ENW79774.1 hypothetical protein F909_02877 [Acinetobacter sp. ANC 3929]
MLGKASTAVVISCAGANSILKWAYAVKNETSQAISLMTLVDGIQVDIINNPPVWLSKELLDEMPVGEVPEGFLVGNGVYEFTNNDSIPHRLEFVILNPEFFRSVVSENPTAIQMTPSLGERVGVCLSNNEDESISCVGATDTVRFKSSGVSSYNTGYNLIVNGFNYRDFNWSGDTSLVGYLEHAVENYLSDKIMVTTEGSGFGTDWTIKNISNVNLRISLVPWTSATDFSIAPENENPTLHSPNNQVFEFCLSPYQFQFSCSLENSQQMVELHKARDTLPFLSFSNVAFNIFENGVEIAHEKGLLNLAAMQAIGLEVVAVDETNRRIQISSMDGVNSRAIELHPTMGISEDVDITQGDAVRHRGSFFICFAKKPS